MLHGHQLPVYKAALVIIGPPTKQSGAMTAPIIAQWAAHANCFEPNPSEYGIDCANIPDPIITAKVANMDYKRLD